MGIDDIWRSKLQILKFWVSYKNVFLQVYCLFLNFASMDVSSRDGGIGTDRNFVPLPKLSDHKQSDNKKLSSRGTAI